MYDSIYRDYLIESEGSVGTDFNTEVSSLTNEIYGIDMSYKTSIFELKYVYGTSVYNDIFVINDYTHVENNLIDN